MIMRFAPTIGLLLILPGCQQSKPKEAVKAPVEYFKVDRATAGSISGRILFKGRKPAAKRVDMDEDPQCAKLHKSAVFDSAVVVNRNGTLANVFVYVKQGLEGKQFEPPPDAVTLDQKGCWFEPRALGIQTGQQLRVTNSDPVTHNIHPRPKANREWNQSQSPSEPPLMRKFFRPEVMIRVKCNIHPWMRAWIGVVDHPYFTVTGEDGSFELANLPPGNYTIEAWQEALGTQQRQASVAPSGKTQAEFTFMGEAK
jgi:plastocyanin